ncbi:MAG: hypothetical protein QM757_09345 [Paludibaculum sp.]
MLSLAEKRCVVELARQNAPKDCLIVSGSIMNPAWRPRAKLPRWNRLALTGSWYFLPTAGRSVMPMIALSNITAA